MVYLQTQLCEKIIPYEMLYKLWEVDYPDIFTIKSNMLLHSVHSYSKFPIVKITDGLLADILITEVKIASAEFGLPKKIVSDADTNLLSDKFRQFCR